MAEVKLLASAALPRAQGYLFRRMETGLRVSAQAKRRLAVHEASQLLAGDTEPVAEFRVNWRKSEFYSSSVTPDLSTAVLSQQGQVVAVDQAGRVRWRVPFTATSTLATRGQVWATVLRCGKQDWVVLDATNGHLLGRVPLLDSVAPTPVHHAHPDGSHVMVTFDQRVHWGRLDSGALEAWETPGGDVKSVGPAYLTTGDPGIAVRRFPDGELLAQVPIAEPPRYWTGAGFLDSDTVVASSMLDHGDIYPEHEAIAWFFDAATGTPRGRATLPMPIEWHLWGLGDGTWLTADIAGIQHWTVDD